ncbi:beta-ketoacyl synthase chain length factor [Longispora albida]|uniref:beta-ketoacyl synthase chain length factor n=1 Tax=Longispora albida TaxID=203523 RepID=UPI00036C33B5|nr:beta-ketoacyl synthase chain length factor [Longispora albida]
MTLVTVAEASWPAGQTPPGLPGFVLSQFSPLAAATAERCLSQYTEKDLERTAVILVSTSGDLASAVGVAEAVDAGKRIGPLLFFQSVPNAVAGHIAARHGLSGPVVSLCPLGEPLDEGLELAALLIADGDAGSALIVHVELEPCNAFAVLVRGGEDL